MGDVRSFVNACFDEMYMISLLDYYSVSSLDNLCVYDVLVFLEDMEDYANIVALIQ